MVRPLINIESNSPFFLPVGLLSIAAAIRIAGHAVRILDFEFEHRVIRPFNAEEPQETFVNRLLSEPTDLVGITTLADTLPSALMLAGEIKHERPDIVVVIGGPGVHGTASKLAARFHHWVDYICTGAGEDALAALLSTDLASNVPGMIRTAASRSECNKDLHLEASGVRDQAFPAYDLVDVPAYLAIACPRVFDLYVGSGCTYKCSFCTTAPFWNHKFSAHRPEHILLHMQRLESDYGIREFNIVHDNFTNDRRYIDSFVSYFVQKNTRYEWGCAVRPDNVPRDLMRRMRSAGCRFLFCGTDAGDATVLRSMKKMTSNARSYRFFNDARITGLRFETNTIIGYPNEDDEALEAALKIVFDAIAYGGHTADVSVLQPLPGAPVTIQHIEQIEQVIGDLQTYIPASARDLVSLHPDIFTGFGFIRCGNRDFEYYSQLTKAVRYFTRHYFRALYFAKERLGITYHSMLTATAVATNPSHYGEMLASYVNSLSLHPSDAEEFWSIWKFEASLDSAKGVDINAEITNVYARPAQALDRAPTMVDVAHEVHAIFAQLPRIIKLPPKPTTYLFKRGPSGVSIIKLKVWQRSLLIDLNGSPADHSLDIRGIIKKWTEHLVSTSHCSTESARAAVRSTLNLLEVPTQDLDRARTEKDSGSWARSFGM